MFEPFNNCEFKIVSLVDLIYGEKYFVKMRIGTFYENRIGIYICYSIINGPYMYMNHVPLFGYLKYSIGHDSFIYSLIKKKDTIQYAMELRAINKLLQRIVGDDTFKY